jgi:RNA polymerase sigma factor (sigma-70 family)
MLMRLAPQDREVLIYRLVHGMSCEEIAEALGCNLESAKKRAQRALQRLRQVVAEEKGATHSA